MARFAQAEIERLKSEVSVERLIEHSGIVLKKAGKDTQALENEIDTLVYRLYDLTDEEIRIVEGKD